MLYLLPQAVDRWAERDPTHEAVRCAGQSLSYGGLARRSAQLARVLGDHGVKRGDRVAIFAQKGIDAAVAMHGVMKAGAAYVPLNPASPEGPLAAILSGCGIRHIVSEPRQAPAVAGMIERGALIDAVVGPEADASLGAATIPWSHVETAPEANPEVGTTEQDLAYVLYTSGSTGVPKGVMHTHRSALAFAEVAADTYGFTAEDRLSNHAPLHFDLSTMDYFSAAVAGATTVVVPEVYTRLPASLSKLIEDERLTVLYAVPLALTHLLLKGALDQRDLASLRWVLFGGEPFPTRHLRDLMRALPGARFSNVYGPTEVNGVTYWPVPDLADDDDAPIPIGRPFPNVELLVLDENDEPVVVGESGELLARTPTMMKGYWRRPDLDEGAFWTREAPGGYEEVFHRTGDLVRLREDGLLDFLGRKDRQVKVHGHRMELDEVEAALTSHPDVETAGVYVVPTPEGSRRIEAALTLRSGAEVTSDGILAHAARRLPRYGLPERLELLDALPRTTTGKIDRRALEERALTPET